MIKIKIFIFYFLFLNTNLFSQDSTGVASAEKASFNKKYFNSYLTDSRDIITAPFHWNGTQWLTAGAITACTGILITQDKSIFDAFKKNRNAEKDNLSKYGFEPWGNNYSFGLVAGFYLEGLILRNERSKKVALESSKALLITSVFTQTTKLLVQRYRPSQSASPDPYHIDGPFNGYSEHKSFFSGHTSTAFALATVLSMEYKECKWLPYVAYTLASGTAWSRLYDHEHWASDVFFGAAAGYFIARLIHKNDVKKKVFIAE